MPLFRFPQCVPLIRLVNDSEGRALDANIEAASKIAEENDHLKVHWFGPTSLFADVAYSRVAKRVRDGRDGVLFAGWSGALTAACPKDLAARETDWTTNAPFSNGADNLFGAGGLPILGTGGWSLTWNNNAPALAGGDVRIPVAVITRTGDHKPSLRALVPRSMRDADTVAVLIDVDHPNLEQWLRKVSRAATKPQEALAALEGETCAFSIEAPVLFPPHPVHAPKPRTHRDRGRILKASSGWYPMPTPPKSTHHIEPEWFSDMPGRAVLDDGVGLVFESGELCELRLEGERVSALGPAKSYHRVSGSEVPWRALGAASFERETARGLRQTFVLGNQRAGLEFGFVDELPGLAINLRWDPEFFAEYEWIEELVPWELPLFAADGDLVVEVAHGEPIRLLANPGTYRVAGPVVSLQKDGFRAKFDFETSKDLPHPGIAIRVHPDAKSPTFRINPFGYYVPIRGSDAARLPRERGVRLTLSRASLSHR